MQIFEQHINNLTNWLTINPNWAFLITFIISLSESLAIVGTIIPGSITMTAIGMLAGAGVMRIDLTLLAAIIGAIGGDSISYMLGYYFKDSIPQIWPFSRYPTAIDYGKYYFERHGGKSVFLGRFVGPLRSIIPLIAGMMRMNHWRFYFSNILSAIGWSVLYVIPGVFIGAYGSNFPTHEGKRAVVYLLIIFCLVWLMSIVFKAMLNHIQRLISMNPVKFARFSYKYPKIAKLLFWTSNAKPHHQGRAITIFFIVFLCVLLLIKAGIITFLIQNYWKKYAPSFFNFI